MPKADPKATREARQKFNKSNKTEIGNDLPRHDLGGHRLDRSLADNLPVRRERPHYMGLAQLTERAEYYRRRSTQRHSNYIVHCCCPDEERNFD